MDPRRAALLSRCADAYRGLRDANGLSAVILAMEQVEAGLGALILSSDDNVEIRGGIACLADFRSLSRSRAATCWHPRVKRLTMMVNSVFNGWRMEDVARQPVVASAHRAA